MNPQTLAWIVVVMTGAFCGVLTDLIIQMIRAAINKAKPWLVAPDEEGGTGFIGRANSDGKGNLTVGKGTEKKVYPVKVESRHASKNGIFYILGRQTGVNLTVPSKDEIKSTLSEGEKVYFEVCDPLLLAKVMDNSQVQQTLEGQNPQEDWRKSAIPWVAGIAGLALVAFTVLVAVLG